MVRQNNISAIILVTKSFEIGSSIWTPCRPGKPGEEKDSVYLQFAAHALLSVTLDVCPPLPYKNGNENGGEQGVNGIFTSALQPSNFFLFSISSYLFLIILFYSLFLLHCSRFFFAALFSSLPPVCL